MNTVDALSLHGGHCANFLDTGGKATSETVKSSFRIIASDPRVKAIFVNIFGGLTRCDMIAEGIIMAFRDLHMAVPVVVRLRGTNEEVGQMMVRLPSHLRIIEIKYASNLLFCAALRCAALGKVGLLTWVIDRRERFAASCL